MPVIVQTRGPREITLRFTEFPVQLHQKLRERISALTGTLMAWVQAATPVRTGRLRGEEAERVYSNNANRVAGYVSVYAPDGGSNEYAKAATLEYGTNKPRRAFERTNLISALLSKRRRAIAGKLSKPVHIAAFRYLRAPLDEMRPEIEGAFNEAIAEAAASGTP